MSNAAAGRYQVHSVLAVAPLIGATAAFCMALADAVHPRTPVARRLSHADRRRGRPAITLKWALDEMCLAAAAAAASEPGPRRPISPSPPRFPSDYMRHQPGIGDPRHCADQGDFREPRSMGERVMCYRLSTPAGSPPLTGHRERRLSIWRTTAPCRPCLGRRDRPLNQGSSLNRLGSSAIRVRGRTP